MTTSSDEPLREPQPSATDEVARSYFSWIAAELGRELVRWLPTVTEPTDNGYLFGFELDLRTPEGALEQRLVFVEAPDIQSEQALWLRDSVGVRPALSSWVYPRDPGLPALGSLLDPASAAPVLARLGIDTTMTGTRVVSYRPGRRAVVRVDTTDGPLFVKVVEPVKAAAIAERHQQFRANSLPVPRLLGWSREGIVAISGLSGVDAQGAVPQISDKAAFLDQVEFLVSLLSDIPAFNTARSSLFDRLDWYVDRLAAHLPQQRDRVAALGSAIQRRGTDGRAYLRSPVTVHGDLHLGQLFVDAANPAHITGLLDIDTAGAGDPADDAGALYAHLVALGEMGRSVDPEYARHCWELADLWAGRWHFGRDAGFAQRARAIAATHLLGHALRPVSTDGDAAAVRLVERAERLVL